MNDTVTFTFKQHITFFMVAVFVAGTCFLLDMNFDNLPHVAKKATHAQLMAQISAMEISHQTTRAQ